ncbi:MAG: hypothetical protein HYZ90_04620 [Candidatus Omnitrophica bacterium]|nr:hypothetical protein [Candidatus Omnitrophota bacterium]
MRSRWMRGLLLAGALMLGTGASADGMREAREWTYAADLALICRQPVVSYSYYRLVADTFPETRYGRYAAKRARWLGAKLQRRPRSPETEGPGSFIEEAIDFVTWP